MKKSKVVKKFKPSRVSRRNLIIVAVIVAAVGSWLIFGVHAADQPPSFAGQPANAPLYAPDEILMRFKPGTTEADQTALLQANSLTVKEEIPNIGVKTLKVPPQALEAVVLALTHNPAVEFAEPNFIAHATLIPNDPLYSKQWGIPRTQTNSAWDTTTGNSTVVIGEVDTGVKASYADLSGKVLSGGYDYINNDNNPDDDNGHGTAVARTMAAVSNNGSEIAGYCWNCKVLPVKALNSSGSGTYSAIANAVVYAADHGARIINMSLGGSSSSSTLNNAVQYAHNKGSILIAAAGNNGTSSVSYPAASPGVISVAASTSTDKLYSFSQYGSWVDIAAPGCSGTPWIQYSTNVTQADFCGTSQASPVVSGIAGLLLSKNGTTTNTQLESALLTTADACCSGLITGGRVNAYRALAALGSATLPSGSAPVVTISSPANGITIKGNNVTISATAVDDGSVVKMEIYLDGQLLSTANGNSISYRWSTNRTQPGLHSITVVAYDNAGNNGQASITVLK